MTREYIAYETDGGIIEREEIVRCHDCCHKDKKGNDYYCTVSLTPVKKNDFCSKGDRGKTALIIAIPKEIYERLCMDYKDENEVTNADVKAMLKAIYNGKVVNP